MAQALGAQPLFAAPPQFDSNAETWTNYSERLESYFDANEITDDARKRAILITCLNPEVYGRLRSLLAPKKPRDEPYEAIIALLKQHLNPAPSEIYETYRFQTRVQKTGEKKHHLPATQPPPHRSPYSYEGVRAHPPSPSTNRSAIHFKKLHPPIMHLPTPYKH
ncbi:uncharacterized protein LOC144094182 [Amblyomma americanum]